MHDTGYLPEFKTSIFCLYPFPSWINQTHWAMNFTLFFFFYNCCCSVNKLCPTLRDLMGCSTPGFPVLHHFPDLAQINVHWISDAIQPSYLLSSPSSFCLQSFPVSGAFTMSWLFSLGGQSIGASASASVLPMNTQGWFPLRLTGLLSLRSKGLSVVFSNTAVWKHQFFSAQSSLWSNSHNRTWLLFKVGL